MRERVQFPSNGHTCEGYFARPASGKGPAVVVIQEWWGLVPHIEDVVDRFAADGFIAIAPDLYHGSTAASPDEARKLRMELDSYRAEKEIAGAGTYLLARPECSTSRYGVVGFCLGGALAQLTATREPKVGAAASFYGGFKQITPDWINLHVPLLLIYGEKDEGVPPAGGLALAEQLKKMGKEVELKVYEGAGHAFFNDARPDAYEPVAAEDAWGRTVALFRSRLR